MKKHLKYLLFFTGILVLAGLLRLPRLSERPMHLDEAVHGIKFGMLLEDGIYVYDKEDFHGPSLNYLTLPIAWLSSQHCIEEVSEVTLRSLPALAGVLTILLLLLLVQELGWATVYFSALFMAFSPALAYYSRYYIQETLLVCFCFGLIVCGFRACRSGRGVWFLAAGVFGGLAIATKETWIIHFFVLLLSAGLFSRILPGPRKHRWLLFLVPLVMIPVLLYSSFFRHPSGMLDALTAYATYFDRAGADPDHLHPWYFYFSRLGFARGEGMLWSEGWILLLALAGMLFIALDHRRGDQSGDQYRTVGTAIPSRKERATFQPPSHPVSALISIYGLVLLLIYTLMPYKTPWVLLNFYQVLIIPAGFAAARICMLMRKQWSRFLFAVPVAACCLFTLWQAWQTVYIHHSDPANPLVYAHPTTDVFEISDALRQLRNEHPEAMIEVVYEGHEYWPLPWYLRDLEGIGWWAEVDLKGPAGEIVLADPSAEPALLKKWYEIPPPGQRHLYVPLFDRTMEIRHGAEIRGYVRRDLLR